MPTTRPKTPRRQLPTPPSSPYSQTPRPLPLPLPTEKSRYRSFQIARSRPLNGINDVPATPAPPLRSISSPAVITHPIGSHFSSYARNSSAEPETETEPDLKPNFRVVPKSEGEVYAEIPDPYTVSYYEILGLPESPHVTTKDIEEAYHKLLSNPPSDFPYSQATLKRIHKVLTNSIRRRTYDLGRRTHLLIKAQRKDRAMFEKKLAENNEINSPHTGLYKAKIVIDESKRENLNNEMECLSRQVVEKVMTMGMGMGMDGVDEVDEEETLLYDDDEIFKGPEPRGERLSIDFEFNGSGSEDDSGEEDGSGGSFSEGEENGEVEESEKTEKLSASAVTISVLEATPSNTEIIPSLVELSNLEEEPEEIVGLPISAIPTPPPSPQDTNLRNNKEEISHTHVIIEDTEKTITPTEINTIVDLLYPALTPKTTAKENENEKAKENMKEYKEIWEFDYDSSDDCNSDTDTDTDTDSDDTLPTPQIKNTKTITTQISMDEKEIWEFDYNSSFSSSFSSFSSLTPCFPSSSSSPSSSPQTQTQTQPHPKIQEPSYAPSTSTSNPTSNPTPALPADPTETHWLAATFTGSILAVSALYAWFGRIG
ncbi:hypothetical protein NHQ30_002474 [Ciborinia camelliae]|nr:hypothetical protein NHQ30_002474 [Ciborinia camelliae]